jgi:hypothetical protein
MLRAVGRGVDTTAWGWMCGTAGQMLFAPPNVAGWDDTRWLDTATFRARWSMASAICRPAALDVKTATDVPGEPAALVRRATAFWGDPPLSNGTRGGLEQYARAALGDADAAWKRDQYPVLTLNALRMLVAVTPDYLTS